MTPQQAVEQGMRLHAAGRLSDAERFYAAALGAQPGYFPALHLLGSLHYQQGRYAEALAGFDKVLAGAPGLVDAWNNRGLALNALGRRNEALASFERAIALNPDSVEPLNNRGDTLRELKRHDEALADFERAIALRPDYWAAHSNRGLVLSVLGRMDEALASFDRALALQPDIPEALHGRSHILWTYGRKLEPATRDLERLVQAAPDFPFARGGLMRLRMYGADWDDYGAQKARLDEGVRAGKQVVEPFIYLGISDRPDDLLRCARIYAAARFPARPAMRSADPRRREGRIRVGYVCGEFRTHATMYLSAGLYEAHDRAQFEIFAFDNGGGDGGPERRRLEAAADRIIDITALPDPAAAARILAEDIDILVDLNGYAGNLNIGVFAHRPAPVQVNYLAFPGTLGAPYMDYLLADAEVIPEDEQACYTEKIAWLPDSYQINDDKRVIAAQTPRRADEGLPDDAFVFCNFNTGYKLKPDSFAQWMGLLRQVEGSVLWLQQSNPEASARLRHEAERHGVSPARLIFAGQLPMAAHLARLRLADLFLDGLPYGAHTTASDALWAGLPLLTRRGPSFAGRVAASLLKAVGLPELVTDNAADYEALALRLARDAALLKSFRDRLAENRLKTPLFDTMRATRHIEDAFRAMFEHWQRGEAPQSFRVAPRP